jgi:hypothetical protein
LDATSASTSITFSFRQSVGMPLAFGLFAVLITHADSASMRAIKSAEALLALPLGTRATDFFISCRAALMTLSWRSVGVDSLTGSTQLTLLVAVTGRPCICGAAGRLAACCVCCRFAGALRLTRSPAFAAALDGRLLSWPTPGKVLAEGGIDKAALGLDGTRRH